MGIKLFKSTEEKMVEAMLHGITPEGLAVKSTVEKLMAGLSEEFMMVQYRQRSYSAPPLNELILLKVGLSKLGVGLVLYEEAGIFFISRSRIMVIKDKLLPALGKEDDSSPLAWIILEKLAWLSGIPLASVKYFSQGFEVKIFTKDQKPKQVFIDRHENS